MSKFLNTVLGHQPLLINFILMQKKAKNYTSYIHLVNKKVITKSMAEKIAGSGLQLCHLEIIYKRGGEDGLRNSFQLKNEEGKQRVPMTKKTIDGVIKNLLQEFNAL